MTHRPFSMLPGQHPDEQPVNRTPLALKSAEPSMNTLPLGQMSIRLYDPDFRQGYQEGASDYERWHGEDQAMEAATLLFLVRNGWGDPRHSAMWQTGYIVGWLFRLFTHACNVGEVKEP